jgi:hypothetical protein
MTNDQLPPSHISHPKSHFDGQRQGEACHEKQKMNDAVGKGFLPVDFRHQIRCCDVDEVPVDPFKIINLIDYLNGLNPVFS